MWNGRPADAPGIGVGAAPAYADAGAASAFSRDRKSTRLNSSHSQISYAVFCLKKKNFCTLYAFVTTQRPRLPNAHFPLPPTLSLRREIIVDDATPHRSYFLR